MSEAEEKKHEEKLREVFDKPFEDVIDYFSDRIDLSKSKTVVRGSLARKIVGLFILALRAFRQSYQFVVVILLIIGLRGSIRTFINSLFGWNLSTGMAMVFSVAGVFVLGILGYFLFFRWGSQRASFELGQKMNPAQMQDWAYYRLSSRVLYVIWKGIKHMITILEENREDREKLREKISELEGKVEELEDEA